MPYLCLRAPDDTPADVITMFVLHAEYATFLPRRRRQLYADALRGNVDMYGSAAVKAHVICGNSKEADTRGKRRRGNGRDSARSSASARNIPAHGVSRYATSLAIIDARRRLPRLFDARCYSSRVDVAGFSRRQPLRRRHALLIARFRLYSAEPAAPPSDGYAFALIFARCCRHA